MENKFDVKFFIAIGLILLSVASRLLPLPANFSPIMAVALFSGIIFSDKKVAFLIPVSSLLISDIFLGLHLTMIGVYASFCIIALLGMTIKKLSFKSILTHSILGAIIFFIITNFTVWVEGWYSYTALGLVNCYQMAIPFFRNTLVSSIVYSVILFGGFYLADRLLSIRLVKKN